MTENQKYNHKIKSLMVSVEKTEVNQENEKVEPRSCAGSKKLDTHLGVENSIQVNSIDDVQLEAVTKTKDSHRL